MPIADSPPTNLRILQASRARLRAGDIFVLCPKDRGYLFGRVIDPDTPRFGFPNPVILCYIYRKLHPTADVPASADLQPDALLIPPFGINRLPWSRGYFHTVGHRDLGPGDVLARHVFRRTYLRTEVFLDIDGNEVTPGDEPVGEWGLNSYRTVDDDVSRALGMDLAPDE